MPYKSARKYILFIVMLLLSNVALADVCVWRDPERTMIKLFPQAEDYKKPIDNYFRLD